MRKCCLGRDQRQRDRNGRCHRALFLFFEGSLATCGGFADSSRIPVDSAVEDPSLNSDINSASLFVSRVCTAPAHWPPRPALQRPILRYVPLCVHIQQLHSAPHRSTFLKQTTTTPPLTDLKRYNSASAPAGRPTPTALSRCDLYPLSSTM